MVNVAQKGVASTNTLGLSLSRAAQAHFVERFTHALDDLLRTAWENRSSPMLSSIAS